jgi:hypothetical protein
MEIVVDSNRVSKQLNDQDVIRKSIVEKLNDPLPWDRIKFIVIFMLLIIVDQLLEGSTLVPSIIGVDLYQI